MRKIAALAAATVLVLGVAAAPAQAATAKAGTKCATKLAVAKVGTTKLYCGKNTSAKTKAKFKLAWIDGMVGRACYDAILANNDSQSKYQLAQQQLADIKAQMAKLDAASQAQVATQVKGLEDSINAIAPVAGMLLDNVKSMCP